MLKLVLSRSWWKKLSTAANAINEVEELGPKDLSSKDDKPAQPKNIKFLLRMIGRQYRAFVPSLYDKHPWLEYSKMEDAVYCFHCRHFSFNRKEPTFVLQGFRNWKKCYGSEEKTNNFYIINAA